MSKNWKKLLDQVKQQAQNVQKLQLGKEVKEKLETTKKKTSQTIQSLVKESKGKIYQKQSQIKEEVSKKLSSDYEKATSYLQEQKKAANKKITQGLSEVSDSLSEMKKKVYDPKEQTQKKKQELQQNKSESPKQTEGGKQRDKQTLYEKYKPKWPSSNYVSKISQQVLKKANDMKINDLGKSYIQKSIYEGFQKIFIKVIGIFLLGMLFYGFGKAIPRQIRLYLQSANEAKKEPDTESKQKKSN